MGNSFAHMKDVKLNTEIAAEAAKSAPPATVAITAFLGGLSLNNIIGVATFIYIVLQAGYLVWKWRRDMRRERRNSDGCQT